MFCFRSIIISVEYGIWIFVYQACAMPHLSLGSTEMFIVSFFIMDFLYYVGHRIEHGEHKYSCIIWFGNHSINYFILPGTKYSILTNSYTKMLIRKLFLQKVHYCFTKKYFFVCINFPII